MNNEIMIVFIKKMLDALQIMEEGFELALFKYESECEETLTILDYNHEKR